MDSGSAVLSPRCQHAGSQHAFVEILAEHAKHCRRELAVLSR